MEDRNSKDLDIILTVLETDKQKLADEIGVERTIVSKTLSGVRKNPAVRKKLATALCRKVEALIIPAEIKAEQATAEV